MVFLFSDENVNIGLMSWRPPGYTSQSQGERGQVIILGKHSAFLGSDYSKILRSKLHEASFGMDGGWRRGDVRIRYPVHCWPKCLPSMN